jgi:hypothetical protein
MSRLVGAVRLASIATPHMGQCFGRGGRDVLELMRYPLAAPPLDQAGAHDSIAAIVSF